MDAFPAFKRVPSCMNQWRHWSQASNIPSKERRATACVTDCATSPGYKELTFVALYCNPSYWMLLFRWKWCAVIRSGSNQAQKGYCWTAGYLYKSSYFSAAVKNARVKSCALFFTHFHEPANVHVVFITLGIAVLLKCPN